MTISFGIDVLQDHNFAELAGKRVGLMTNPSAVNRHLQTTYQVFAEAEAVNLVALFAPEHGFAGAAAEAEKVTHSTDPYTGLPVHSLYGATMRPTPKMLEDIDVIVCDIQDVGVRYYTYTWTVSLILEAAGEYGIDVMVLDRPNPLGDTIAGSPMYRELESFVGRYPVPIQHGMTLGELAQMINQRWSLSPTQLTVIPCEGWQRAMQWPDLKRLWIPPSPNMPRFETVRHYAGACLIEGTQLSEGRGTTLPFEVVGAPYINGRTLADHLNKQEWPGVYFRAHTFKPFTSKYAGEVCEGVHLLITDAQAFDAISTWLGVIREICNVHYHDFAWLPPFDTGINPVYHFDRLIGTSNVREQLNDGADVPNLMQGWPEFCQQFAEQRRHYLIYE